MLFIPSHLTSQKHLTLLISSFCWKRFLLTSETQYSPGFPPFLDMPPKLLQIHVPLTWLISFQDFILGPLHSVMHMTLIYRWLTNFLFLHKIYIIPLPSWIHCFVIKMLVPLYIKTVFLWPLSRFDYIVPWCNFPSCFCGWSPFIFLDLLKSNLEIFSNIYSSPSLAPFLWGHRVRVC